MIRHILFLLVITAVFLPADSACAHDDQRLNTPWQIALTDDSIWCATFQGAVRLDRASGAISVMSPKAFGGTLDFVGSVAEAPDGSVWVGTDDGFIMRYDHGDWSVLDSDALGFEHDVFGVERLPVIRRIVFHDGVVWMSSRIEVIRYDGTSCTSFTDYLWAGWSTTPIRDIAIDHDGTVWGVGDVGLSRVVPEEGIMVEDPRFTGVTLYTNSLAIGEDGVFWIGTSSVARGGLVAVDGDSVTTYTTENSGLPSNTVYELALDEAGVLWIGAGHTLTSFDGTTWTVWDETTCPAFTDWFTCLAIDADGTKWIGVYGNGLVRFDGETWTVFDIYDPATGIGEDAGDAPASLDLLTSAPNPFNDRTSLAFTLPEAGRATLDVYSVTGQKVATLVDGHVAAGAHNVVFSGSGLPSGLYIARLTAGGVIGTEKMLLLK